jgi:lipoprotein-anchoring transpeptidase ErfK/SrfK
MVRRSLAALVAATATATALVALPLAPVGAQAGAPTRTSRGAAAKSAARPASRPAVTAASRATASRAIARPAATTTAKSKGTVAARPAASAPRAPLRLEVAIGERRLYAVRGQDTLLATSAAVASQETLNYGGRTWTFYTPKGRRAVLAKQSDPWWTPPDWFYAEVARRHGLKLRYVEAGRPLRLSEGRRLVVRDSAVGLILPGSATFAPLPEDEHVVFGDTLYVPPIGTRHRRISGQLGAYRLDLGEGFLIHGTPDERTIGTASTHGCVRLDAVALQWVYDHVPVGTTVVIR